MRSLQKVFLVILLIFVLIPTILAYCPPYFARVDKVEPEIECLEIRGGHACGGNIVVTKNTCSDIVYIHSPAWEKYEVPSAREPQQFLPGQKGDIRSGIAHVEEYREYRDYLIEKCEKVEYTDEGLCKLYKQYRPYLEECHQFVIGNDMVICVDNLNRGATVKNWTFSGWVGNQNFTVTGRTIYKKPRNINVFLFLSILSILVGIALLIFGIKYKKQSLIICGSLSILLFIILVIRIFL
ncbi:MAG TPA: hypothetical protein VMV86_01250 [Methanosarcinales archaeon]|nr:hypothetical protein [Methanosarcinales archaeon]